MRKLLVFLYIIFCNLIFLNAQPAGIDPFFDAVPLKPGEGNKYFLSNQDASVIRSFFENQTGLKPDRIIRMDHGYHHGFRIYYTKAESDGNSGEDWIQIFTVNTRERLESYQKKKPELLYAPFSGLKNSSAKYGYEEADIQNLINQYNQISTKYYREFDDGQAVLVNEMNLIMQKYLNKLELQSGQMFATGGAADAYITKPISAKEYSWDLWVQCYEEIDQAGYITLIEYSSVQPTSGKN